MAYRGDKKRGGMITLVMTKCSFSLLFPVYCLLFYSCTVLLVVYTLVSKGKKGSTMKRGLALVAVMLMALGGIAFGNTQGYLFLNHLSH